MRGGKGIDCDEAALRWIDRRGEDSRGTQNAIGQNTYVGQRIFVQPCERMIQLADESADWPAVQQFAGSVIDKVVHEHLCIHSDAGNVGDTLVDGMNGAINCLLWQFEGGAGADRV